MTDSKNIGSKYFVAFLDVNFLLDNEIRNLITVT